MHGYWHTDIINENGRIKLFLVYLILGVESKNLLPYILYIYKIFSGCVIDLDPCTDIIMG